MVSTKTVQNKVKGEMPTGEYVGRLIDELTALVGAGVLLCDLGGMGCGADGLRAC